MKATEKEMNKFDKDSTAAIEKFVIDVNSSNESEYSIKEIEVGEIDDYKRIFSEASSLIHIDNETSKWQSCFNK